MVSAIFKRRGYVRSAFITLFLFGWLVLSLVAYNKFERNNGVVLEAIEKEAKKISIQSPPTCTSNRNCASGCSCTKEKVCENSLLLLKNVTQCERCSRNSDCLAVFDSCVSLTTTLKVCATCVVLTTKMVRQSCDKSIQHSATSGIDTSRSFPEWIGGVIYDTKSNFSHIRVRHRQPIRSLIFVEPSGTEQFESSMDMRNPHIPHASYLVSSLTTFLVKPTHKRVLVLGLGGGSMIHFYQHYFPSTYLDVVEIDAAVVEVAKQFFGVKQSFRTRIFTMDAFHFLSTSKNRYDVIYVDAFLNTKLLENANEITSRLKDVQFFRVLRSHLLENGTVAFNFLKSSATHKNELFALTNVFPKVYGVSNVGSGNLAAIASLDETAPPQATLLRRAEQLDRKLSLYFSFKSVVSLMRSVNQLNADDD